MIINIKLIANLGFNLILQLF